ncbi:expressed unknown protein [Seminavis robusta]|uniref:Uncharacterized protein n=1 Tax=Seminavis robusta TaxID=568900 RepID=A0A9N8HJK2_9STRA|nr:expressed unknown protein [Seminavis robusta]|eukprot:Sro668_g184280.1 n/a (318) ;mRNA; r:6638-7591
MAMSNWIRLLVVSLAVVDSQGGLNGNSLRSDDSSKTLHQLLTPEDEEQLLTVIAVTEQGSPTVEDLQESYKSFRTNYPFRPFCVLEVPGGEGGPGTGKTPLDLAQDDPLVTIATVSHDEGDSLFQSDWFDLCNLHNLGDMSTVAISLNVPVNDVEASFDFFLTRAANADLTLHRAIVGVGVANVNWIDPLNQNFILAPIPPIPSPTPTEAPSKSFVPSQGAFHFDGEGVARKLQTTPAPSLSFKPSSSSAPSNSPSISFAPSTSMKPTISRPPSSSPSVSFKPSLSSQPSLSSSPTSQPEEDTRCFLKKLWDCIWPF